MNKNVKKIILEIFDYAYTNSPIKTPSITCQEVGKILHVAMYIEEIDGQVPAFSNELVNLKKNALSNNSEAAHETASLIRSKYQQMNEKWKLYDDEIRFTDANIDFIVTKLRGIYISSPEHDIFGDALELFRSQWAKQEGGQFFTDQRVTDLALEMIDFDPSKGDTLIDLCSGTGGFLLAALNRIKILADKRGEDEKYVTDMAAKSLFGREIDESVVKLGNATLSARTGAKQSTFIEESNSLDMKHESSLFSKGATNPPFGAKISVHDVDLLEQYELAKLSNSSQLPASKLFKRAPDILFVERNVKAIKPGGMLAIVLPYQILSGPQTQFVRSWIVKNCIVEAVVDLPSETFQPHTGTKTCLLVLKRLPEPFRSLEEVPSYPIFFAMPKWIGHDRRGNAIYKKDSEGFETDEILTDFPELKEAFIRYRETGEVVDFDRAFLVNSKEVLTDKLNRLNAACYNPIHKEQQATANKNDFEYRPLGELVKRVFFPGRFKRNYVERYDGAVPFLGGTNITQMISHTEKWLRHDDPKLAHLSVKKGWILITRSGTTGIVSSVPEYWDGYAISEHVIRIVPDEEKIKPEYLLAFLKTKFCQAELARGVFGSVIDEITPETILGISVPLPKDKSLYSKIGAQLQASEEARSKALKLMYDSVSELEEVLGG